MTTHHRPRFYLRLALFLAILAILLIPLVGYASSGAQSAGWPIISPEVIRTGSGPTGYEVTFRFYDPSADRVRLRGEWYFSDAAHTTLYSSAGWLPWQWIPGAFPIA